MELGAEMCIRDSLGTLDQRDAYGLAAVAHGVISVKEAAHECRGAGIEHLLFSQVGVAVVAVTNEKEFVFLPVKDQAGAQLSKIQLWPYSGRSALPDCPAAAADG